VKNNKSKGVKKMKLPVELIITIALAIIVLLAAGAFFAGDGIDDEVGAGFGGNIAFNKNISFIVGNPSWIAKATPDFKNLTVNLKVCKLTGFTLTEAEFRCQESVKNE